MPRLITQGEDSGSGQSPTCMPDPPRSNHWDAVDRLELKSRMISEELRVPGPPGSDREAVYRLEHASEVRIEKLEEERRNKKVESRKEEVKRSMEEVERLKREKRLKGEKKSMESSRTSSRSRAPSAQKVETSSYWARVRARIILALLFVAFWMQAIASISPLGPAKISMIKVFFTGFDDPSLSIGTFQNVTHISLGIWQAYYYSANGSEMHTPISLAGHAYIFTVDNEMQDHSLHATIQQAWPRGLAIQPLACAITVAYSILFLWIYLFLNVGLGLQPYVQKIMTPLLFFVFSASFVTVTTNSFIFWAVQNEMQTLGTGGDRVVYVTLGPGSWLSLIGCLLLIFALLLKIFHDWRKRISDENKKKPGEPEST